MVVAVKKGVADNAIGRAVTPEDQTILGGRVAAQAGGEERRRAVHGSNGPGYTKRARKEK